MDDALDSSTLGACPDCGAAVPAERLLARYLTADKEARVLVQCPECAGICAPVDAGGEG